MSNRRTAFQPLAAILFILVFVAMLDWSRGRIVDLIVDVPVLVALIILVIKSLIDSPSESEKQRRNSLQLNRQ